MGRMRVTLCTVAILAGAAALSSAAGIELVASCREGWIEIDDSNSLQPVGRIKVGPNAESVDAATGGKTLLVTKSLASDPNGCCGLYSIDLARREISFLIEPALSVTVAPKLERVFVQQGNNGVFVFDTTSLKQQPKLAASGPYNLKPSPDGRWLFGITNANKAHLEIFESGPAGPVRRIEIPYSDLSGAWTGDAFYLYALGNNGGHLWKVTPDLASLDSGLSVEIPAFAGDRSQFLMPVLTGSNGHLFVYEVFGTKLDRRSEATPSIPGGVYEIDPQTGAVISALVPGVHFARLVVTPDGETLYGIDVESLGNWEHVRVVKVDRKSGQIQATRELASDVWNIALADIPAKLIPHEDVGLSGGEK